MRSTVDVVIPVYNEERTLEDRIATLVEFLRGVPQFDAAVVIADNASIDGTPAVAESLARQHPQVTTLRVPKKGRGGALQAAWGRSRADIVAYMDVDLSTNLRFFPLLIHGISLGYDVAIGSRLLQASQTQRSRKREVLSRAYNGLVKLLFLNRFSDAQCGFKAVRRAVAAELLPLVENTHWFFDTELLLLAERRGYSIFEVPVEWIEDLDTRVKIVPTIVDDLRGLLRVRLAEFRRARAVLASARPTTSKS